MDFFLRIPSDLNWYYPIVAKVLDIPQNVVIPRSVFQEGHGLLNLFIFSLSWEPAKFKKDPF